MLPKTCRTGMAARYAELPLSVKVRLLLGAIKFVRDVRSCMASTVTTSTRAPPCYNIPAFSGAKTMGRKVPK